MSKRPWGDAINLFDMDTGTNIPVDFGTPLWKATMEWARFHGLDPMRIPAGSVVERDAARCEIRYVRMAEDDDGEPIIVDGDWVPVPMVESGEAPPLPFPEA